MEIFAYCEAFTVIGPLWIPTQHPEVHPVPDVKDNPAPDAVTDVFLYTDCHPPALLVGTTMFPACAEDGTVSPTVQSSNAAIMATHNRQCVQVPRMTSMPPQV